MRLALLLQSDELSDRRLIASTNGMCRGRGFFVYASHLTHRSDRNDSAMEIQIHIPSHLCPSRGEWWIVQPTAENRWAIIRFDAHGVWWEEAEVLPMCPECRSVLLEPCLIAE